MPGWHRNLSRWVFKRFTPSMVAGTNGLTRTIPSRQSDQASRRKDILTGERVKQV